MPALAFGENSCSIVLHPLMLVHQIFGNDTHMVNLRWYECMYKCESGILCQAMPSLLQNSTCLTWQYHNLQIAQTCSFMLILLSKIAPMLHAEVDAVIISSRIWMVQLVTYRSYLVLPMTRNSASASLSLRKFLCNNVLIPWLHVWRWFLPHPHLWGGMLYIIVSHQHKCDTWCHL